MLIFDAKEVMIALLLEGNLIGFMQQNGAFHFLFSAIFYDKIHKLLIYMELLCLVFYGIFRTEYNLVVNAEVLC